MFLTTYFTLFLFLLQRLSIADRANLLDDLYSLAAANEIDYSITLSITMFMLHYEYHAIPWAIASSKMIEIYTLLKSLPVTLPNTASQFQVIKKSVKMLLFDTKVIFTPP